LESPFTQIFSGKPPKLIISRLGVEAVLGDKSPDSRRWPLFSSLRDPPSSTRRSASHGGPGSVAARRASLLPEKWASPYAFLMASLDSLRRFETPGVTRFAPGEGGLLRLEITSRHATAHIYLHGAHLTHFQPAGCSPVIFTSAASHFTPAKAIRGGVPVIFPWFGPHPTQPDLPMHGFARTAEWEVEAVDVWPDQTCHATLRLVSSDQTRAVWPHDFVVRFRVTVGRKLEMALEVENWSGAPFQYEEALHTYFALRDVHQASVIGLQGAEYKDKVDAFALKREEPPAIRFTGETDRLYINTTSTCLIDDAAAGRRLLIGKTGSATTVVWNPWDAKTKALPDLGDEEWLRFCCVETCNAAENAVTLAHGETHVMTATVAVE
jgi:D-hexose-6-phosphate mutarotase